MFFDNHSPGQGISRAEVRYLKQPDVTNGENTLDIQCRIVTSQQYEHGKRLQTWRNLVTPISLL